MLSSLIARAREFYQDMAAVYRGECVSEGGNEGGREVKGIGGSERAGVEEGEREG